MSDEHQRAGHRIDTAKVIPRVGGEAPDGWKGTPPAEGTRRRLILDTVEDFSARLGQGSGSGSTLELADAIEEALMVRGAEALTDGIVEVECEVRALQREVEVKQETIDGLAATVSAQADRLANSGDVPRGTKELHIVLAPNPDADSPQMLFVELEDQEGRGLGGFGRRQEGELTRIVIPYGRDDAWITELAYQAAGAATRPLLEDHPDYVFPAERVKEAVAWLLETYFGIPRACGGCQEEQLEHGRQEAPTADDYMCKAEDEGHMWPKGSPQRRLIEGRSAVGAASDKEVGEDREAELLEQREEARTHEGRFAEERDCAYALLRWLLPVTVAKRLD